MKQAVCGRGHVVAELGRRANGDCIACCRLRSKERRAAVQAGAHFGGVKPIKDFCVNGHDIRIVGRLPSNRSCRECSRILARKNKTEWRKNNREEDKRRSAEWRVNNPLSVRTGHLRRRYGISPEDYAAMVVAQGGHCAICQRLPNQLPKRNSKRILTESLVIDHDHRSGKVRGLLCWECNIALGRIEDYVPALIKYLHL